MEELVRDGRKVIMVGDGLNDSAALSRAHVGISMSDSSALAKDVANVLLLDGRLDQLCTSRLLSERVMRRIRSNYWLIVSLNSVFLGLGLFGLAGPALTALMHNTTTAWVAWRGTRPYLGTQTQVDALTALEEAGQRRRERRNDCQFHTRTSENQEPAV